MITNERSFKELAQTFYDNSECNSIEEFKEDIGKISLIRTHFVRFDEKGTTNIQLMLNHFISFINCFGIVSEQLMHYKLKGHTRKINSLFVLIGKKQLDGITEIDEDFFIEINKVFRS